jgi:hypothetical protein
MYAYVTRDFDMGLRGGLDDRWREGETRKGSNRVGQGDKGEEWGRRQKKIDLVNVQYMEGSEVAKKYIHLGQRSKCPAGKHNRNALFPSSFFLLPSPSHT